MQRGQDPDAPQGARGDAPVDEAWVDARLAELDLAEKVTLVSGADAWRTAAIDRVGIPAIKVTDGPNGARGDAVSGATAACFPVGSALGATWNPALLEEVGRALAEEARSKGAQVLLGPTVNIHRTPLAGRNFECYSEDPFLTAQLAIGFIDGLQEEGIGACIKHFVGNESEFERMSISSVIDERTLREIYLLPFELAVARSRPWSVMGAYNRLNGTYACANRRLLVDILKHEWGFDGLVISDWGAVYDTVGSANGGCDLEMPGPPRFFGPALAAAVDAGDVPLAEVDDKVRRVLRTVARSGRIEHPDEPAERSEDRPEHRTLARRVASESIVLLTNAPPAGAPDAAAVLPLSADTLRTLAVVGPNAERSSIMGGGSSIVRAHHQVHPLAAIRARVGSDVEVVHASGGTMLVPASPVSWFAPTTGSLTVEYFRTDDASVPRNGRAARQPARAVGQLGVVVPPEGRGERRAVGRALDRLVRARPLGPLEVGPGRHRRLPRAARRRGRPGQLDRPAARPAVLRGRVRRGRRVRRPRGGPPLRPCVSTSSRWRSDAARSHRAGNRAEGRGRRRRRRRDRGRHGDWETEARPRSTYGCRAPDELICRGCRPPRGAQHRQPGGMPWSGRRRCCRRFGVRVRRASPGCHSAIPIPGGDCRRPSRHCNPTLANYPGVRRGSLTRRL
jgi:beta-glucosidase-like glycosyl hydrolase